MNTSSHLKNHTGKWITGGIVAILIVLSVWAYRNAHAPVVPVTNPAAQLPGIQTSNYPWAPEITHLKERLQAIGLPALSEEGTALHIHQHLDIYINGKQVSVPADIGINQTAGFISPIHIHDDTSIIHVESPTVQDFTLGQFFDIWGVAFTSQTIGGYQADGTNSIRVYVNGMLVTGDPRAIVLQPHQEIVITYGTTQQLPHPLPSSYSFPAGL